MANMPNRLNHPKLLPVWSPNANAIAVTMSDWKIARTLAENTFDSMMAERETGVLRTLFMKPKRLSHTTDMPTNAVVKTVVNATMLMDMKEK